VEFMSPLKVGDPSNRGYNGERFYLGSRESNQVHSNNPSFKCISGMGQIGQEVIVHENKEIQTSL